jgi:transcriptional regulator with XRE-family HTH domain
LAGLVGRSSDWLKKIETGTRQLNSLQMLVRIAQVLGVSDLAELTGADKPAPVEAWNTEAHHVVPAIRKAMRDVAFPATVDPESVLSSAELQRHVHRLWLTWHTSPQQRTMVGDALPTLISQAHATVRAHQDVERRRAMSATGDLYRLVQRLLAHICEPEPHALAVERGRAMSEDADTPLSLALAAWSSSVALCASGHYDDAIRLADAGTLLLAPLLDEAGPTNSQVWGTIGALQMVGQT